jgi:hypothetical protein
MTKKRLYNYLFVICAAGYAWLLWHICFHSDMHIGCLFYKITGIPCPSCGSTRSVLAILHGDFAQAWQFNPFGFLIVGLMIVVPLWILTDWICRKDSFFRIYQKTEYLFKKKSVYIPAIALVLGNWIWNFFKY